MNLDDFKSALRNNVKLEPTLAKALLYCLLDKTPIPTVQVNSNTLIERAVVFEKSGKTENLTRLSYAPDAYSHHVKEGRFNKDGEPHFYGAFTDLDTPSATRYFLACEIDPSIIGSQNKKFNFTVGKWRSVKSFSSVLFMFNVDFCNNELLLARYNEYVESDVYKELSEEFKDFLRLITDELARPKGINGYLISNLVFDYYKSKGFQSIIYPGVQAKYRGNNIAMTPKLFDESFEFFMGAEFCLNQIGADIEITENYRIDAVDGAVKYSLFGDEEIGAGVSVSK